MTLQIRKAEKSKSKLRIGLSGPSGSGKTYSALLLASGLTNWSKICVIDTENGSADLYSHLGNYSVITLEEPYQPERYIEAIDAAQEAGFEVIIIDSASHEWEGRGGCLEINERLAQAKYKGNSWAAWNETTPRHQRFIQAITTAKCHIITTARAKTDTIQTEDKKVKKVGMKEIQREGFEYELTVNFTLDRDGNYAIASKDRTGQFSDRDPFKISAKTGEELKAWAESGAEPVAKVATVAPAIEQIKTQIRPEEVYEEPSHETPHSGGALATDKQKKYIYKLISNAGLDVEVMRGRVKKQYGIESFDDLTATQASEIIEKLINYSNS